AYQKHRHLQLVAHEILSAQNAKGEPDGNAQWQTLQGAVQAGRFAVAEMPNPPEDPRDVWVACEYAIDDRNNFQTVVRFYRDSEIRRHVSGESQTLILRKAGQKTGREATSYRQRGMTDELEPAPNPVPGR